MALQPRHGNCDRARAWVSLRLDGEISELEEAFLESHLRRCADCREYETTVRGAVLALRAEPLERMEHPVLVTRPRRVDLRPVSVARVAAAVAAVVGMTAVLGTQLAKEPSPSSRQPARVDSSSVVVNDFEQLRTLRVLQLGGRPPRGSNVGSFGAVLTRQLRPPS